jgi:N-acetylglucosaminyl-diphospho-decaprenol L-rhamnosyltransferase|tara:strand:+ start:854 stop:1687 length:834 start_codon:yes stop_codon:yes gene_type:complete
MNLNDLTIIITTFKSDEKINSCLNSINKKVKVIIIENSGSQRLKKIIENKYSNVEYIVSKENLGYAKANNLGLKSVKTKFALVLNPDTILNTNALEEFFKTASNNPDFFLIGPGTNQSEFSNKEKKLTEVKNIKGFAIFFNMKKFKENIFFDENYFLYFEEIDLCRQISKKNGKIFLDPNIEIYHEGSKSVNQVYSLELEKNRNWHWMWSTFYYHKKYNNYFYALLIISPKLFSALFKTIFYSLMLNKQKRDIYYCRLSGILNSILGKKSWYRPSLD